MKRSNMQQAFIGEDDRSSSDFSRERDGNEQVILRITGGTLSLVVSGEVADVDVFDAYQHVQGEVVLEGGKVFRFQMYADGACTSEMVDAGQQTMSAGDLNSTQANIPLV